MANLAISNLCSNGSDLFSGSENFMSEISESDLAMVFGGKYTPPVKTPPEPVPFPEPIPTPPIVITTKAY
ncbi:hypothetical protein [Pseudanabaena sp. PCC 6802]|uniref:hypothetical protein n=1 Tax=Pseudanabaena sp. PCC 6802 TaxID=118173 RepID=UPI0003487445|nr:hypothetical protein [Pseudanabaena sp. PCC 6802]